MNAPTTMTGIAVDEAAVTEAKALGIDVVRACEAGLRAEIRRVADARWAEENRPAMEAWNDWVDRNGLPLAGYRVF